MKGADQRRNIAKLCRTQNTYKARVSGERDFGSSLLDICLGRAETETELCPNVFEFGAFFPPID